MDVYDSFVKLSLQQCTLSDYKDKTNVRVHNQSTKKLYSKMQEISDEETLLRLLSHDDDRVKINAILRCFQLNILDERIKNILNTISINSSDPSLRFSAKMLLQQIFDKQSDGSDPSGD